MKKILFLTVMLTLLAVQAEAYLDLTTAGSNGFLDEAFFIEAGAQSTGTGVIDSFVRLQKNGSEEGYNTSGRNLKFDENNSPQFTKDLSLSSIPIVVLENEDGDLTEYREFLLDVNQNSCPPKKEDCIDNYISLDALKIYLSDTAGNLEADPDDLGDLIFELTEDNIKLNYDLNSGSGSGDMFAYIPNDLFGDSGYVYLYSKFGLEYPTNDGFEEWAVRAAVPEPASMLLFGLGTLGLFVRKLFS